MNFNRIWSIISDPRFIVTLGGLIVLIALQRVFPPKIYWSVVASIVTIFILWIFIWWYQNHRSRRSGDELIELLQENKQVRSFKKTQQDHEETQHLRMRMNDAIRTIRKSRLGDRTGRAALYELPWYMMIGNPAAGKSSAIQHSGLRFPFADQQGGPAIRGIGGTRNCDWFFSTEGILLDTAGRYAVHEEDHKEWLSFLGLLKKHRSRAPINGIIIGVSVAELTNSNPEHVVTLAKNLRSRVQDLTEKLEVFAPVYIVFTKMDLLSGFTEFFSDYDQEDRAQVWGATIPFKEHDQMDAVTHFDQQLDVLYDGLKDLGTTHLTMRHHQTLSPSIMTFPLEFKAIRPALRTFIATLFEDNPFQFKPVFRGFYFTSALQEGQLGSPMTAQMLERFGLKASSQMPEPATTPTIQHGYFLNHLFSKVILADRHLVRQHTNRDRRQRRHILFLVTLLSAGILLSLWTWSYMNNQQLVQRVAADLAQVKRIQSAGQGDMPSQLKSLEILQDRLEQLDQYDHDRPWSLRFGLYQGDALKTKVRQEYLLGIKEIMLKPVSENLEKFLGEVNANGRQLQPTDQPVAAMTVNAAQQYKEASPTNVEDAYNALKAYLMLGDHTHMDQSHLNDQITRFWRTWLDANRGDMSRSDMIRSAERIISYSLSQSNAPDFPVLETNLALVDQTRDNLRRVVKGMPARDRVYAEIKMRASARYPTITVAQIVGEQNRSFMTGNYVIAGTFTKAAWDGYISQAIDKAATENVQGQDWVLNTVRNDDLTLTGSPEQIRKDLIAMYKRDDIAEWKKFIQSIDYVPATDFNQEVTLMNGLGDPELSPILKLFTVLDRETGWDNPSAVDSSLSTAKTGFFEWVKRIVLQRTPSQVQVNVGTQDPNSPALGILGAEFAPLHNIVKVRDDNQKRSFLMIYLSNLSQIRTRLNKIKSAGDIGPGSLDMVKQTLNEGGSELNSTQQLIDEQILAGATDSMKQVLRPLLIKPLTQSFSVLITPAQNELNKVWAAQVYQPFSRDLAQKYPFTANAHVEATGAEIGRVFGESGSVSTFVSSKLDPIVTRRGDQLSAKTWNDIGIHLEPQFIADFPRYLAPVAGGSTPTSSSASPAAASNNPAQTTFQIMPVPVAGLSEYTIEVDGQRMRYRNGLQEWTSFVWPNPSSQPGVKITGMDFEGRLVTILDVPGAYGLERMMSSAQRKKLADGTFELKWVSTVAPQAGSPTSVTVKFRLISGGNSQPSATGTASTTDSPAGGNSLKGLQLVPVITSSQTVSIAPTAITSAAQPTTTQKTGSHS
ncbi:MAG: type VI secretion system membrane subunit TssM [Gammaproteobacteria bacterium]|nr:type VI secretion system membrane subunit TssM [Gammaproteobacteria bacterium]